MNRRQFLALTIVAALSPKTFGATQRKIRKAIMHSTIGVKGSVLEKYRVMKEAGFEGVEPMGGMAREDVVAALKETGLQAASVCCHTHWAKPLSAPDEGTRKIGLDGLILSLEDAKAYGASSVLLVPGVARDGVTYQQCFDRSIVEIKKAIPIARDCGVKIAIENVGNNFIVNPEQAVAYLDAIDSEWVGFHFDIGNAGRVGPAEKWINALGKRILKIHVKDFSAQGGGARPKLLDGNTNWPAVMKALDDAGYTSWGISEQPSEQAAGLDSARDLAARMEKIFNL